MKKTLTFTLCLSMVFLSLIFPAFADTAYLQLDRNEYYETSDFAYNMEDKVNSSYLYDFSLNGHHANLSLGTDTEGIYGRALQSPIEITNFDTSFTDESHTIEFWVYPTSESGSYLMAKNGTYPHLIKGINESIYLYYDGGSFVASNISLNLNEWNFIAVVVEYISLNTWEAEWFINDTSTTVIASGFKSFTTAGLDWANFVIGRYRTDYATSQWSGKIDDMRMYRSLRTESQIETDMVTSTAVKLIVEDLEANEDVVQLWFENETLFEQLTADSNGEVEFNVFSFSDKNGTYNGVLNVYHTDIQYEGYIMVLNWGDVYKWMVLGLFEDLFTQLFFGSGAWLGLIGMLALMFSVSAFVKYIGGIFAVISFFMGILYFQNVASNNMFMWSGIIMWVSAILLLYIGIAGKK